MSRRVVTVQEEARYHTNMAHWMRALQFYELARSHDIAAMDLGRMH